MMKTKQGTIKETKQKDGRYVLVYEREYDTQIFEVKNDTELKAIKKKLGVIVPTKKKAPKK